MRAIAQLIEVTLLVYLQAPGSVHSQGGGGGGNMDGGLQNQQGQDGQNNLESGHTVGILEVLFSNL